MSSELLADMRTQCFIQRSGFGHRHADSLVEDQKSAAPQMHEGRIKEGWDL